jgi:hypothetical protein
LLQSPGNDVAKTRFSRPGCRHDHSWPDLLGTIGGENPQNDPAAPMILSVANTSARASPMRGLLPLWVGLGVYALFLLAGNRLLIDSDTMWQITVGEWILDHRAV